jgi:hypothetical protein
LFVHHAFGLHWEYLKSKGCHPKQHIVCNDGCYGQFKSAKAWYFLGRYHNFTISLQLPIGCQVLWNYFASGHGKWKVDGVGALLNWELWKEKIKPHEVKIQNAQEVVNFLWLEANKFHATHLNVQMKINKT